MPGQSMASSSRQIVLTQILKIPEFILRETFTVFRIVEGRTLLFERKHGKSIYDDNN